VEIACWPAHVGSISPIVCDVAARTPLRIIGWASAHLSR
jgi:hypothetical protein